MSLLPMRPAFLALLAGLPAALCLAEDAPAAQPVWRSTGFVDPGAVREASGLVASRRQPGVYWTHGDSGTDPKLIAVDASGAVLGEVLVAGAPNTDWEDLAADDAGHLYIGDIGNTAGIFPVRYIYKIAEPDPRNPPTEPVPVLERIRFKYPDGKRVDAESLFYLAGSLYVLPRGAGRTAVYRVEPGEGSTASLVLAATLSISSITAADVSADGQRMLLSTPHMSWVAPLTGDDTLVDLQAAHRVGYPKDGTVEGACFDGADVVLITESGFLHRVTAAQFEQQVRFREP